MLFGSAVFSGPERHFEPGLANHAPHRSASLGGASGVEVLWFVRLGFGRNQGRTEFWAV